MSPMSCRPPAISPSSISARIKYPLDDPRPWRLRRKCRRPERLWTNTSQGCVSGRRKNASRQCHGHAGLRRNAERVLTNLRCGENVLPEHFVWQDRAQRFYGRRAEWFEHTESRWCCGTSPRGQNPPWRKASSGSIICREHGTSDHAFGWPISRERNIGKTARCGCDDARKRACRMTKSSSTTSRSKSLPELTLLQACEQAGAEIPALLLPLNGCRSPAMAACA